MGQRVTATHLPHLPDGHVALLATLGPEGPWVIPLSGVRRVDGCRLLLALKVGGGSARRLRRDGRAALSLNGPGFSACVRGRARAVADPLPGAEHMAAFELEAHHVWDARGPATEVEAGVRARWTTAGDEARHNAVLAALDRLADGR